MLRLHADFSCFTGLVPGLVLCDRVDLIDLIDFVLPAAGDVRSAPELEAPATFPKKSDRGRKTPRSLE